MKTDVSTVIAATGLVLIAEAGSRAASIRAIADRAGLPPPTLQHHYPSKALLYRAIYATAVERHLDASLGALAGLGGLPAMDDLRQGAAGALLGIWLAQTRDATLVILNLLAHAARDADYADLARDWNDRLASGLAAALHLAPSEASCLVELLIGLVLTSTAPGRILEYDLLNREVLAFVLGGQAKGAGRWRGLFWRGVGPGRPEGREGAQRKSIQAALDAGVLIMAEAGAEALTYRNIANRAAISASSVQHGFPTRSALVLGVYQEVRRRYSAPFLDPMPASGDGDIVRMFARMIVGQRAGAAPLVLASCELFLSAAWEADLADHAWEMRLARGMLLHDRQGPSDFQAHVQSLWTLGLSLVQLSRHPIDPMAAVSVALAGGLPLIGSAAG